MKNIFIIIFMFIAFAGNTVRAQEELFFQPINNITVSGNQHLSETVILNLVSRNTAIGQRVNQKYLEEELKRFYQTGYFQSTSVNYFLERGGVHVQYLLRENPVVNDIAIAGNSSYSGAYLVKLMKTKPGTVLNYQQMSEDIERINAFFAETGYTLSQVSDAYFDSHRKILFIKIIEPTIGTVFINGGEMIRSELFYRELEIKQGDVFNSLALRKSRNNLLRTGLLGSVDSPKLKPSLAGGKVDVIYDVHEKKANQVNFGYGISSREQFGFVKLTLLNFFTWGETMTLRVQDGFERGEAKQTYRFRFYTPWVFNRQMSFAYERYISQQYEELLLRGEVVDLLSIQRIGWGVELGLFASMPWVITTEYYEEDVGEAVEIPEIGYTKKSLAFVFLHDNVKNDLYSNAASGEFGRLKLEGGGYLGRFLEKDLDLGGRTFGRYEMSYSRYISLDLGKVLAWRAQAGIFNVDGTERLLEGEQYLVGGSNTVRGYLDIYPFAVGTRKFIINLEYRHSFSSWFQGVLFYDWGNAFDSGAVYIDRFYSGRGIGVRFGTPLGHIRFDWAFGDDYVDASGRGHYGAAIPRNVIHFSLGQTF